MVCWACWAAVWRRPTCRDSAERLRREERPLRRAGVRRLPDADQDPRRARLIGPNPIEDKFTSKQQAFLDFVLRQYVQESVHKLDREKLQPLLKFKYNKRDR